MTVPGARAVIVKSITDLERLRLSIGSGPLFAVMSPGEGEIVVPLEGRRHPAVGGVQRAGWCGTRRRGNPSAIPCCPDCTAQVVDKDGVPLTDEDLNRRKHTCAGCGGPPVAGRQVRPQARYPLADYVKHRMRGFFDLLIGDEVHEFKVSRLGPRHRRGHRRRRLRQVPLPDRHLCSERLQLRRIFHLLYRFSPGDKDGVRALRRAPLDTAVRLRGGHRRQARRRRDGGRAQQPTPQVPQGGTRERPGLVPSALFHIIANTVFLRLSDVDSGLPPYEEQILLSSMDSEEDGTGYSQRSAYNTVFEELRKELAEALKSGSKRLLAIYLQTLLAYPDGCTRGETVFDPRTGDVIVQVPPLSEEKLYPKEKALVDLVAAERMEGRRVLVYVTHTGTRDITGRMDDILTRHGFRVAVMKADAVAPNQREAWVADKVKEGIDVLICHPRLVQTGLDLIDFQTLCWYETEFSVFQSTQKSTVLMGSRSGCDQDCIGFNRLRRYKPLIIGGSKNRSADRATGSSPPRWAYFDDRQNRL